MATDYKNGYHTALSNKRSCKQYEQTFGVFIFHTKPPFVQNFNLLNSADFSIAQPSWCSQFLLCVGVLSLTCSNSAHTTLQQFYMLRIPSVLVGDVLAACGYMLSARQFVQHMGLFNLSI